MSSDAVSDVARGQGGMRVGSRILLVLVILSVVVILLVWVFNSPRYRAASCVYVESPHPKNPLQLETPPIPLELMDRYVADQAVLLKDDQVLTEVLKSAVVMETEWYRDQPRGDKILVNLKDQLSVERIPKTNYLKVSFATKEPKDASSIVNTVIKKCLAKVQQASQAQYSEELRDYDKEERRLSTELKDVRNKKREFMNQEIGIAGVTEGVNVIGETWRTLAMEVTRLEAEKLHHKATYENLIGVDPSNIAISPEMRMLVEQDPQIGRLRDRRLDLELELGELQARGEDDQEDLQVVQTKMKVLDKKLGELMAEREQHIREYQVNVARTRYLNAMQAELQLRDRMLEAEHRQRDLDQALAEYRRLEEDQKLLEHQLAQIREHINLLKMVIKDRGMVPVRQVGAALPPKTKDYSEQAGLTVLAVVVPLLFGILLFVVRGVRGRCGRGNP
ncbi:MAG: GumC domain-containing protein, partial [Planctomycetota bacterium]|jgi:uncharacterized protein involved in exopolysaccharide biosynthesis